MLLTASPSQAKAKIHEEKSMVNFGSLQSLESVQLTESKVIKPNTRNVVKFEPFRQ